MGSSFYSLGKRQQFKGRESDDRNAFFDGWSIHDRLDHYEVCYIAGGHGGGVQCFCIDKSDFELAKRQEIGLQELCEKYME